MSYILEYSTVMCLSEIVLGLLLQAGGSSGCVFAWDLRGQQEPIILSSIGHKDTMTNPLSESEVWEVRYDCYTKSLSSNISSSRLLPAMICSEDGILAVIEQGTIMATFVFVLLCLGYISLCRATVICMKLGMQYFVC